ncbi:MAG TPA: efflux RND transporter periplasmic adaptor subunit [Bacteroidia bacterium]|nr:efflux RND transporter periplasmic adaptor subunit [Bacteroidia bacterium]
MKFIAPIFFAMFLFASCEKEKKEEAPAVNQPGTVSLTKDQMQNVKMDTASLSPEENELSLTGKISFDESKVGKVFPLVGGNVVRVDVALGDKVTKGECMAEIRSAEISDVQTQYLEALNNEALAKKNLDIANELFSTHVNSETQVLAVKNEYLAAQAESNRLKQELAVYGASTSNADGIYHVFAPMDGFVVEKNVNEAMEIRPDNGTNIFTVSSLNTVWVLADVYESDLAKISLGEEVEVTTLAYSDKIFKGTISQVGNLLDPESKTMKIRVALDNPDGLLKPEMFAVVNVHVGTPVKKVSVSSKALIFDNNRYYMMVKKSDGIFEKRVVQPGTKHGDQIFVEDGLKDGEIVITEGSLLAANNN